MDFKEAYDRARLDALLDRLTGLGNHRAFQEELDVGSPAPGRIGLGALMLVDVDDLKKVNDERGARGGRRDAAGRGPDHRWAACAGPTARSGSAATSSRSLLPDCGPDEAEVIARRILAGALSGGPGRSASRRSR